VDLEAYTADSVIYVVCLSLNNNHEATTPYPVNGSAVFRYDSTERRFARVQYLPAWVPTTVQLHWQAVSTASGAPGSGLGFGAAHKH